MRIELLELKLRNFKGIKDLTIDATNKNSEGSNLAIYGDNGAGKTTIADAFYWLLFDKDSQGKSTFDIKTIDPETKEAIHNLEHEVEGIFEVDGKKLTLKKTYYEVWRSKKGSVEKTFDGHTTDYEINEVPKKAGEYQEYIASIIDEDTFKLLTNPTYFNEQLKWQQRRDILIEVCGNVSDQEVLKSDKKLSALEEILAERSLEDHKDVLSSKMNKIDKKMKEIPARIDENDRNLPDISGIKVDEVQADMKALKGVKAEREKELVKVQNGGGIAEKEKKLAQLETKLIKIEQKYKVGYEDEISETKSALEKVKDDIADIEREINIKKQGIKDNEKQVKKLEDERAELKEEWHDLNDEKKGFMSDTFESSPDGKQTTCPTCGQELPEEDIESARKDFNRRNAECIEKIDQKQADITKQGKAINKEIGGLRAEISNLEHDIEDQKEILEKLTTQKNKFISDIKQYQEKMNEYQDDFQYKKIMAEADSLMKEIKKLEQGNQDEIEDIKLDILGIDGEIDELQSKLNTIDDYNKKQERIQELNDQLKKLAAEYERLEGEMFLVKQFETKQSSMLEVKINGQFELAEFKLFDKQVNGDYKQTCETIVEGVPYGSALNRGHQRMAGVDIINRLSRHYDFYAPIFADDAEGVSIIPGTKSQLIRLVKPSTFKDLAEEVQDMLIEKYGSWEKAQKEYDKKLKKLRIERDDD